MLMRMINHKIYSYESIGGNFVIVHLLYIGEREKQFIIRDSGKSVIKLVYNIRNRECSEVSLTCLK